MAVVPADTIIILGDVVGGATEPAEEDKDDGATMQVVVDSTVHGILRHPVHDDDDGYSKKGLHDNDDDDNNKDGHHK
jgi:hypothetical protein